MGALRSEESAWDSRCLAHLAGMYLKRWVILTRPTQ